MFKIKDCLINSMEKPVYVKKSVFAILVLMAVLLLFFIGCTEQKVRYPINLNYCGSSELASYLPKDSNYLNIMDLNKASSLACDKIQDYLEEKFPDMLEFVFAVYNYKENGAYAISIYRDKNKTYAQNQMLFFFNDLNSMGRGATVQKTSANKVFISKTNSNFDWVGWNSSDIVIIIEGHNTKELDNAMLTDLLGKLPSDVK